MRSVIGIDMGGTKCAVIHGKIGSEGIEIVNKIKFPTGIDMPPAEVIDKIKAAIRELDCDAEAIGISCGGPLDSETGTVLSPPNLPLWDNIHICDILKEEFGIPAYLQNDADACALAEWQFHIRGQVCGRSADLDKHTIDSTWAHRGKRSAAMAFFRW